LNTVGAVLQTTDKGINLSKAEYIEGGREGCLRRLLPPRRPAEIPLKINSFENDTHLAFLLQSDYVTGFPSSLGFKRKF